jgi:hypothetical protein
MPLASKKNKVYEDACVYRVFTYNSTKTYIGSTVRSNLKQRLYEHKYDHLSGRVDLGSGVIIALGDYDIEEVVHLKRITKPELGAKEQYYITIESEPTNKARAMKKGFDKISPNDPINFIRYLFMKTTLV